MTRRFQDARVFVDADDRWRLSASGRQSPAIPRSDPSRSRHQAGQYPELIGDAEIVIVDHTSLPTEIARQCTGPEARRVHGHRRAQLHEHGGTRRARHRSASIKGYGDTAVAECAIALMWAAARGLAQMDREIRAGNWLREDGMQLTGKTLGLIGFGGIAAESRGSRSAAA